MTANLSELLSSNTYPGRGILIGLSPDGATSLCAYFIMGRSTNSRNRIFVRTQDGIRTQAYDPAAMTDPSLIIYHPVRDSRQGLIVTNGDQTDTIQQAFSEGKTFEDALGTREFEPDKPNYTPRISGLLRPNGSYILSILKSSNGNPDCCCRQFFDYSRPLPGIGHLIHTYAGDGTPLPSFAGEPEAVQIEDSTAESLADRLWEHLNMDNKVSLFVRSIHLVTGETHTQLRNKNGKEKESW
jgi:IMP cyclohydrolase